MKILSSSPTKLSDGTWGARVLLDEVPASAATVAALRGQILNITARSGKTWQAKVSRVVWAGANKYGSAPGVALCATVKTASARASKPCDNCQTGRAVTRGKDSSGFVGNLCAPCYRTPVASRSFA